LNKMFEDRLGMFLMLILYGFLSVDVIGAILGILAHSDEIPLWGLIVASRLTNLTFLGLIVWFTATRLPARGTAQGITPRVAAVAGTFLMMTIILVPFAEIGPVQRIVSTVLTVTGTVLSIICIFRLGRSFSIAPTARALVTRGPYGIVRHPLYAAELVTILGSVLSVGSVEAFMMGVLWFSLQILRARYEEKVLSATFPEYHDYARRVPMIVPGLKLFVLTRPLRAEVKPEAVAAKSGWNDMPEKPRFAA
jgi:protein-S-isoprenylcysteine O-methyltransferase Ste14